MLHAELLCIINFDDLTHFIDQALSEIALLIWFELKRSTRGRQESSLKKERKKKYQKKRKEKLNGHIKTFPSIMTYFDSH